MFHNKQDLTALISSRICHDLVSPLGAISNGLELLSMQDQETSPEMDLIGDSIANANSKIRFFRVAYGSAPASSTLAQGEILPIIGDYFADSRVSVSWNTDREAQRRDIKLVFLALQCLESALPYGGTIEVNFNAQGWVLRAENEKLNVRPDLWAMLEGQGLEGELAAAHVQFGLLADLSQWRKPALSLTIADTFIQLVL